MLWFNGGVMVTVTGYGQFQYILCCGSTKYSGYIQSHQEDFNTSYVVVQPAWRKTDSFGCSISIHLMLWFNIIKETVEVISTIFQYILCCGSTVILPFIHKRKKGFQYILCCGSTIVLPLIFPDNKKFQYILCCGSTDKATLQKIKSAIFQYILCCGSTFRKID